jgi:C1A family cysteine protease
MVRSALLASALAVAAAHPSFEEWAAQYGFNGADDAMRAKYNANLDEIDQLNAADNGATFAVNQFSGMTFEEFEDAYLTNTEPDELDATKVTYLEEDPLAASVESIDWVAKGGVTPVKDQGQCGSCWAFSTMGAVEAVYKINTGKTVNLAEQQLVDCDTSGQSGCSGGSATTGLQWLESHPACTTASYKYKAAGGTCKSCSSAGVTVGGVKLVTSRSESALQSALGGSPASVSVYADSAWQHYSSGVLKAAATCSHNHAVLAVGYTSDAWKIKNSWGKSFGESGYIRITKGLGGCGASGIVTQQARIPTGVSMDSVAV